MSDTTWFLIFTATLIVMLLLSIGQVVLMRRATQMEVLCDMQMEMVSDLGHRYRALQMIVRRCVRDDDLAPLRAYLEEEYGSDIEWNPAAGGSGIRLECRAQDHDPEV